MMMAAAEGYVKGEKITESNPGFVELWDRIRNPSCPSNFEEGLTVDRVAQRIGCHERTVYRHKLRLRDHRQGELL